MKGNEGVTLLDESSCTKLDNKPTDVFQSFASGSS